MKYLIIIFIFIFISPCYAGYYFNNVNSGASDNIIVADSLGGNGSQYGQIFSQDSGSLAAAKSLFLYCRFTVDSTTSSSGGFRLMNFYGYQAYTYQRLCIYNDSTTSGNFAIETDTQDISVNSYETSKNITYDGNEHTFGCLWEIEEAEMNIKCTIYCDDYSPEVLNLPVSSWTYKVLVRNNISFLSLSQGISSVNYDGMIKDFFVVGSLNEHGVKQCDKLYRILRAGHSGQTLINTQRNQFYIDGVPDNTVQRHFSSNCSWINTLNNWSTSNTEYLECNNFISVLLNIRRTYPPDYIRTYNGKTITSVPHNTYYTNTLKRRR